MAIWLSDDAQNWPMNAKQLDGVFPVCSHRLQ
jgi:hypothetical protein